MQDSLKGACHARFYSHINVLECNRGAMKDTQLKIIIICLIQDLFAVRVYPLPETSYCRSSQLFFLMSAPS